MHLKINLYKRFLGLYLCFIQMSCPTKWIQVPHISVVFKASSVLHTDLLFQISGSRNVFHVIFYPLIGRSGIQQFFQRLSPLVLLTSNFCPAFLANAAVFSNVVASCLFTRLLPCFLSRCSSFFRGCCLW